MSIKTYEIHNSYLQDAPESAGITRMVSEADYLSQLQQTDALQTSLNNIINAFGISGEGAHSKVVIEYVHGLVAENGALKDSANFYRMGFKPTKGAFGIEYKPTEALLDDCGNNAMDALKTPATDAAIAEIKVQGVGEFAADMWKRGNELVAESAQKSLVVQVRLAAKLADTYVDNLRAGRKG